MKSCSVRSTGPAPRWDSSDGHPQSLLAAKSRNRVLVPLQTDAGHVGNVQVTVANLERPLEDRIGPILPLEPMRGLGGPAMTVRRDFGIQMGSTSVRPRCPQLPRR